MMNYLTFVLVAYAEWDELVLPVQFSSGHVSIWKKYNTSDTHVSIVGRDAKKRMNKENELLSDFYSCSHQVVFEAHGECA